MARGLIYLRTYAGRQQAWQVVTSGLPHLVPMLESILVCECWRVGLTLTRPALKRRVETVRHMGAVSEERVTVRYDDFDNPVEEVWSHASREMRMEEGVVRTDEQPLRVQHVAFRYQYDAYRNWTERIVSKRVEPDADLRPSNIERRTIAYFLA